MNFTIDIGNTRTKTGVFDGEHLIDFRVWEAPSAEDFLAYLQKKEIRSIAWLASGRVQKEWVAALESRYPCTQLTASTALPFKNLYQTPQTLGKDRLAAVAGSWVSFPQINCLIVNAGTCVTYDFLDGNGNYHGGSITPGLRMRFRALHEQTAQLPLVETAELNNLLVGFDTTTAIRTGVQIGAIVEMDGFIAAYEQRFGKNKVLITGGDAPFYVSQINEKNIFFDPHLVLKGLNFLINFNEK